MPATTSPLLSVMIPLSHSHLDLCGWLYLNLSMAAGVAIFILLISFYSTREVQGVTEAEKFGDSYLLWLMSWWY
ncbi:hypothetical protein PRUPE_1G553200 [Prunus persica]|uniref:Uncharacterized protein n=1 Tax=Prunus persica TaxID=3760 RepID=A0A251RI60_PRUPE|nr:hypothetical protein PRUPE_1G553200 [Prunus persica]